MTTCELTDFPVDQCGCPHHHRPQPTVISITALERIAGHPLPAYRMQPRQKEWRIPEPKRTVCTHRKDDLCGDCETILAGLLYDLPELVEQLGYTLRKSQRFEVKGYRQRERETPDESPIPWSPAAARCLADLHRFMLDAPLHDRHWTLETLSGLARKAHGVIGRPRDREMTQCPRCRADIVVTDRSRTVTCSHLIVEDDPDAPEPKEGEQRRQRERVCDYAASWEQHRRDLLEVNADAMLTMRQLVDAFSEPNTPAERVRNRVRYLVARHGLPREQVEVLVGWADGKIRTRTEWVYRLGDVQDMMRATSREAS